MNEMTGLPDALVTGKTVVAEDGNWLGLPLHYGWPADEQERFEAGRGFTYLGSIGLITVSGPDRLTWLTTLTSQVLTDLQPGDSAEGLLLDPQGHIEFQFAATDDGETLWLLTEPQFAADLAGFLKSMQFMLRVEVTDRSRSFTTVLTSNQTEAGAEVVSQKVSALGGRTWTDPWPEVTVGGARYFTGVHPGRNARFRLFTVPVVEVDELLELLLSGGVTEGGAVLPPMQPVGMFAAQATRVAAWRPLRGSEVDDRALPAELDWMRTAIHLEKGCYRGQESVARIINLGRPPRRLVFLQLDGSAESLPAPGTAVELNGRQVGVLTSVARHWEMGPIALALVKRTLDPALQVKVGGVDAAQELIVPVEGRSDHSPKERPGAGLKRLDPGKRDIRTTGPGAAR
ncbi:CAF17-like 4Fe-4S cluster assembly/insertion protein YgfZ [Actinomyces minihominis]|uniref:CAF17-like 4Fe-4S cluster assembly/insertion protein YgfZ n=1 Tax=Actinomyces minihominis TaxID=2002838 RepID=UPI0013EC3A2E|nr:folate-binding protein YgfZ [Actinomyces minihominis]